MRKANLSPSAVLIKWMVLLSIGSVLLCGCGPAANDPAAGLKTPTIAVNLPIEHNTPDGMAVDSQNNIILSCPNFNDLSHPVWMMKITPDDKLEPYFELPVNPETDLICPLGIAFGSDGNLYIADCQAFGGAEGYASRLLKLTLEDGKPVRCEAVVNGFAMSNGVAAYGDQIYVTETKLDPDPGEGPIESGVYRFALAELDPANPITLEQNGADPHLIVKLTTDNPDWQIGANGVGFGADGTMYVCNFGNAQLVAVTFDADGKPTQKIVAEGGPIKSTDGLKVDPESGLIYIADFLGNAVHAVDPATGKVTVIAQNGPTDGADGLLDKCSEVCLRDNKIYVSNIDIDELDGNKFDKPYTISVIELDAE